jgi:pimeloyl-ACP methyl ester carboxylesterase
MLCVISPGLRANALLGEDFRLFVPWVDIGGLLYSAGLDYEVSPAPPFFRLTDFGPRAGALPDGMPVATMADASTVRVPRVEFRGAAYDAVLRLTTRNSQSVLEIASAVLAAPPASRGEVVDVVALSQVQPADIPAMLDLPFVPFPLPYPVATYRLAYQTVDPHGDPVDASALLALPMGAVGPLPLLSYQHGTAVLDSDAPSEQQGSDGYLSSLVMAAAGYAVVAPDYLGFGDSEGLHPFVHGRSSATVVVDAIRAARAWLASNAVDMSGDLFLAGYSEGGYVTMTAQREIETRHAAELPLTAVAPMAGPYSLSEVMMEGFIAAEPVASPYYYAYTVLAYQQVYGLAESNQALFAEPYAGTVPPLFDGQHDSGELNAAMPPVPADMLDPTLLAQIRANPDHPFRLALQVNDAFRFVPGTPTRLYHCTGDDRVPFGNSQRAYDYFTANGAASVELVPLGFGDHEACAVPALLAAKAWFDSLH